MNRFSYATSSAPYNTTLSGSFDPTLLERPMRCDVKMLSRLLLEQWHKITHAELERTRYIKRRIAFLIEQKYGIHYRATENYLSNLERTLPFFVAG